MKVGASAARRAVVSTYFARLTTICPATTVAIGTGCSGSGGVNVMTQSTLPWIGSSFRTHGTGFPANAVAFCLVGLASTNLPWSSLHPAGLPGCSVFTFGDVQTTFHVPVAGAVDASIAIPRDPFLVGLVARAQMTSVELDPQLAVTAITSSNAIDFTLGQF